MKKRLFVGLPLTSEILKTCQDFQKQVERVQLITPESVRWMPADNLHVTVFFLGSVYAKLLPTIKDAIGLIASKISTFDLVLSDMQFAPSEKEPRMIWAVFAASREFTQFTALLTKFLESRLYAETQRKFRLRERHDITAHVTLARLKHLAKNVALPTAPASGTMTVKSCNLYESHTFPSGSHYTVLETFPLGVE